MGICGSLGSLGSLALIDQFLTSKGANPITILVVALGTLPFVVHQIVVHQIAICAASTSL
jgi:hypothetical protein